MDYKTKLVLWIASSIILYASGVNIAWYYRQPRSGRLGRLVERAKSWPYIPWFLKALEFLYYIGIPYTALVIYGVVPSNLLGLTGPDYLSGLWTLCGWTLISWFGGLGKGLAFGGGAFISLFLIRKWYARVSATLPFQAEEKAHSIRPLGWWVIFRDVVYSEIHWAFYRSCPILFLGDYWGVFVGFLIVILEWWIDPAWRASFLEAEGVTRLGIAFSMAIVYLFTQNLWLVILVHLTIAEVIRRIR
jgi:hypothetical protein